WSTGRSGSRADRDPPSFSSWNEACRRLIDRIDGQDLNDHERRRPVALIPRFNRFLVARVHTLDFVTFDQSPLALVIFEKFLLPRLVGGSLNRQGIRAAR